MSRDDATDGIVWFCPVCRDNGLITGWRNTRWDLTPHLRSGRVVSLLQRQADVDAQERFDRKVAAYEFLAELIAGPIAIEKPISRRVRISGDKTVHDLHDILRTAFDWQTDEPYDFMFGAPYEPGARRFTGGVDFDEPDTTSDTLTVTLDALELTEGQVFGYVFDFGEQWIHRLTVVSICRIVGGAVHSCVLTRNGVAPPQHPDPDDPGDDGRASTSLDPPPPMSCLYGPYVADEGPDPQVWLVLDEIEQLMWVAEAHEPSLLPARHQPVDQMHLHAMMHCLAESKLATTDRAACAFLRARRRKGVPRHQAIHELGCSVLEEFLNETAKAPVAVESASSRRRHDAQPRAKGSHASGTRPHKHPE